MAFHVVYSRHYWDYEDGNGTFDNSWTIYRNVPYSELFKMKDAIPSLKENADQVYADYEAKRDFKTDPKQFHMSEVFIVDDEEYYMSMGVIRQSTRVVSITNVFNEKGLEIAV